MRTQDAKIVELQQRRSERSPLSRGELISQLSACLTMVRPVGMDDDAATEWLTVAAADIGQVDRNRLMLACKVARRECTHHAQILPVIMRELDATCFRGGDAFLAQWHESIDALDRPKLENKSEAQKLIESAAKSCKA